MDLKEVIGKISEEELCEILGRDFHLKEILENLDEIYRNYAEMFIANEDCAICTNGTVGVHLACIRTMKDGLEDFMNIKSKENDNDNK